MHNKPDEQMLEAMRKNPSNWRGPFYFNRKDPRLMVRKYYSHTGSTFNFASPYPYITIAAIIIIVLAARFLG